jgi:putative ABC transport system permease protein
MRVLERAYLLLLRACPPSFRAAHGAEIRATLRDVIAEPGRHGLRTWIALFGDLAATAVALRAEAWSAAARDMAATGWDRDLRLAVRALAQRRLLTAVAVVALGLGIGANTVVFSVVEASLLRPLPYAEPDRLVAVAELNPSLGPALQKPSPGNFLDWRERNRTLSDLAVWYPAVSTLRAADGAEVVDVARVSPQFFDVMGIAPVLGRTFDAARERGTSWNEAEKLLAGDRVMVVSDRFWRRHLGADPAAIGRDVVVDAVPWKVVGVMPASFAYPRADVEAWLPWDIQASYAHMPGGTPRDFHFVEVVGRLAPHATLAGAQADLGAIAAQLGIEHPLHNQGWGVRVVPLREHLGGGTRRPLLALLGAFGVVLLLACANVASLQMAHGAARGRELAMRLALDASRTRLLRQLGTESLVLALVGGLAGIVVAVGAIHVLRAYAPAGVPHVAEVQLNAAVVMFASCASIVSGLVFGLVPALALTRRGLAEVLQEEARSTTPAGRGRRTRRLLVVGEVALALVLLAGAGLLTRSFAKMLAVDPGFDTRGVLAVRIALDTGSYMQRGRAHAFYADLLGRLRALPGARTVAAVTALPMSPLAIDFARPYWPEGRPPNGDVPSTVAIRMATPDYFQALGMRLRQGRGFDDRDARDAPPVVVVNETLARAAWPEGDVIGKRLVLDYQQRTAYPYTVVGVVNDTRFYGPRQPSRAEVFIPHAQNPYLAMTVVVKSDGDPRLLLRAVQAEVRAVDPNQPVHGVATMDELMSGSMAADRSATVLVAAAALVALVLCATGIYGVLAFLVSQRTQEIGVRMALGAARSDILRLVLGESLRLSGIGAALGLVLAVLLGQAARGFLFEVRPTDPLTLGAVTAILVLVAVVASLWPARRAAGVDPVVALRGD